MGIDIGLLKDQCSRTLGRTDLEGFGRRIEGKVRDSYVRDGQRVIVVTDRTSVFDVVITTLPFKGQVLNEIAAFWLEKTRDVAANHLIAVPDPCVSVVQECRLLPVEFVMRGYLTGVSPTSIWTAYERGERTYCGHRLPDGLHKHEALPAPLLTPTTKAEKGSHDEPSSRAALIERGAISEEHYAAAERIAHALFEAGTRWAASRGLILVDTKYEMGLDPAGRVIVIDEVHTPDSSRYWYRDTYQQSLSEGRDPEALDKEFIRRWVSEKGWKGEGPPPEIPIDVRCEAARRYIETYELITGRGFTPSTEEPKARIRTNLTQFFSQNV